MKDAKEQLDKLFYYPYTLGKHIDRANRDLQTIKTSLSQLSLNIGTHSIPIQDIGSFEYLYNGKDVFIQFITWSTFLKKSITRNLILLNSPQTRI